MKNYVKENLKVYLTILLILINYSSYSQVNRVDKAFLLGKHNYLNDTTFIRVDQHYSKNIVYLKRETYKAYIKMHDAAVKDGVNLTILSGTRSFNDQSYKWSSKWNSSQFSNIKSNTEKAKKLLRWWSMPGTSRHHWGTDIDLTNMKLAFYKTTQGIKMFKWLQKNAFRYGFYQPFNANRTMGYQEEKWHWSYLPQASTYLNEYIKQITYKDIAGFDGWQTAKGLDVINTQVLAINISCKLQQ